MGDLRAAVSGIDDVQVYSPDKPILVAPGEHKISISVWRKHVFFGSQERMAMYDRRANFLAGHRYVVRATKMGDQAALSWIQEGADGRVVGDKILVGLKATFDPVTMFPVIVPRR